LQTSQHIGGFLGLDLIKHALPFHLENLPLLTSARACMHFILQQLKPELVYVPFYICDTLLEAFKVSKIPFQYYALNENLEPKVLPQLNSKEYFLWINYFGIKSTCTKRLFKQYNKQLIIDNSQALFAPFHNTWGFNSARKFVGVPDGAFLFSPQKVKLNLLVNEDFVYSHLIEKTIGNQQKAYQDFLKNEALISTDLKACSPLSKELIAHTNFEYIKEKRRLNFKYLHQQLGEKNLLKWEIEEDAVPLCYPFLPSKYQDKKVFHQKGFYIPSYWQEVVSNPIKSFTFEKEFAQNLLPLPIDQQCEEEMLKKLVDFIVKLA